MVDIHHRIARILVIAVVLYLVHAVSTACLSQDVRLLGSVPGLDSAQSVVIMPSGRRVLYAMDGKLLTFDLKSKTSAVVAKGDFRGLAVSPRGDRIAWVRHSENVIVGNTVLSMPVDPETGLATGPAVSIHRGHDPQFSFDGQWLAFAGAPEVLGPEAWLYVTPAAGGTVWHTTLATDVRHQAFWSADGKYVLAESGGDLPSGRWFERTSISTGIKEKRWWQVMDSGYPDGKIWAINGDLAIYTPAVPLSGTRDYGKGPSFVTRMGRHGELPLPIGAELFNASFGPDGSRLYAMRPVESTKAVLIDLASGNVRDLSPSSEATRGPVWSADGKRLAFLESNGSALNITVMNVDGSGRRRYPVSAAGPPALQMQWAPNGKTIAFAATPRGALSILDLASGQAKAIAAAVGTLHSMRWLRDSRAIRLWKGADIEAPNGQALQSYLNTLGAQTLGIYEVGLNGNERLLRDLTTELKGFTNATWVSDDLIALADSQRRVLLPIAGGPRRDLLGEVTKGFESVWSGGEQILSFEGKGRKLLKLDLTARNGEMIASVDWPNDIFPEYTPIYNTSTGSAIVVVQDADATPRSAGVLKLYSVALAGSPPALLATLPGSTTDNDGPQLSPDGRTLAMTVKTGPTDVEIFDLDLKPLSKGANR